MEVFFACQFLSVQQVHPFTGIGGAVVKCHSIWKIESHQVRRLQLLQQLPRSLRAHAVFITLEDSLGPIAVWDFFWKSLAYSGQLYSGPQHSFLRSISSDASRDGPGDEAQEALPTGIFPCPPGWVSGAHFIRIPSLLDCQPPLSMKQLERSSFPDSIQYSSLRVGPEVRGIQIT